MIEAELNGDKEAVYRIEADMRKYLDAIRIGVRKGGYLNENVIKNRKLSGEVLHRRTGRLSAGVHTEYVEDADGASAITGIGKGLEYGRAHELGFEGDVTVKAHTRLGRPVKAFTKHVKMPVRSFLRSTLNDNRMMLVTLVRDEMGNAQRTMK